MKSVIHEVANEAGSKDEASNGKEQVSESREYLLCLNNFGNNRL